MMKFSGKLIAGTALATMVGFGAMALEDDKKKGHPADTNGDGVLEKSEALSMHKAKFAELDKDGDGYLTVAELPEQIKIGEGKRDRGERGERRMQFKGKSFEEIWPQVEERLKEKGKSEEEIAAYKEKMEARAAKRKEREGEAGERREKMREKMKERRAERKAKMEKMREEGVNRMSLVGRLDADGDEKVSLAEFTARAEKRFDAADKNGDGKITKDERPSRKMKKRKMKKEKAA